LNKEANLSIGLANPGASIFQCVPDQYPDLLFLWGKLRKMTRVKSKEEKSLKKANTAKIFHKRLFRGWDCILNGDRLTVHFSFTKIYNVQA